MNNEKPIKQSSTTRPPRASGLRRYYPALAVLAAAITVYLVSQLLPARARDVAPAKPTLVDVLYEEIRPIPEMQDTFLLHGVVEPNKVVKVAAEVSGQIVSYGKRKTEANYIGRTYAAGQVIDEGEAVTAGDPIVLLDTDMAKAEFDRAKAQADYDRREFDRVSQLSKRGVATQTELDLATTKMNVAKAQLVTAREKLERATIVAPISGVLDRLPEEQGQFVQPGTCVAQIVDMSIAKVVVEIPEKDIRFLREGDKAQIVIDSLGGKIVEGEITFISELADERARTTRVEISASNEKRIFRSGQIVMVHLVRQKLRDVVMVPLQAVIPLEVGRVVYVVNGDRAERREVKLGLMKGRNVRVLEGLAAGDRLIVSGHRFVGPGQKVRAAPAGPEIASQLAPTVAP